MSPGEWYSSLPDANWLEQSKPAMKCTWEVFPDVPYGGNSWDSLMLVCRFWRSLALTSSCLWQTVDIFKDTWWLDLALEYPNSQVREWMVWREVVRKHRGGGIGRYERDGGDDGSDSEGEDDEGGITQNVASALPSVGWRASPHNRRWSKQLYGNKKEHMPESEPPRRPTRLDKGRSWSDSYTPDLFFYDSLLKTLMPTLFDLKLTLRLLKQGDQQSSLPSIADCYSCCQN
ncbi:hypothetical protein BV20DRAFT_979397 [Pilatotrama ljubarskyi]|nr:hypothetical protein BV20DRAFT_979397 [Pilatotrama ljubarskyi]